MDSTNMILSILHKLQSANEAYRNGTPTMSDAEYDDLWDRLVVLTDAGDANHPNVIEAKAFLASVGAPVADGSGWAKVRHAAPMGSLNKAQTEQEALDWYRACGSNTGLIVSDKCDGISVSLRYEDGHLVRAATRGDGEVGEDITRNVIKMKGVVHFIKGFTGHLRGEIILRKSDWKAHFPTYSNPRNAASGIAKRLDGEGVEHLTVLHYQLLRDSGTPVPSKAVEFHAMSKIGCALPNWIPVTDLTAALQVYQNYCTGQREALDYDIDGLVIEHNDLSLMETLGDLNKRPKGAVALKFPHDTKPTVLRNIRWQVGKSGRITPVAEFDTVNLAGANVSNATLHNLSNIEKLCRGGKVTHLSVGDEIMVSRRNDVIPGVESVIQSNSGHPLKAPDECPACKTLLIMQGEYLLCRGEDCPAQVLGGISRWVKKIGVLGLGDSIIEALIEHAGVTDPADLYTLDPNKIEGIPTGTDGSRLGRTAHIIVDELKSKAELPLHVLIGSLGIPLCARSVCKTIVDAGFDDLDKIESATLTQIANIPGIGSAKAAEFINGVSARRTLIDKLLDNGVTIKAKSVGVMTGKSVCFTGVRSPEMEKAIEDAGGTVKGSVGSGLTYLVQKDASSMSGKSQKAAALGVQIVDLDGMWAILGRPQGGTQPVQTTAARTQRKAQPVAKPPAPASVMSLFGDDD